MVEGTVVARVSPGDLGRLMLLCFLLLGVVLAATYLIARTMRLSPGCDRAAILRIEEEPGLGRADGGRPFPAAQVGVILLRSCSSTRSS